MSSDHPGRHSAPRRQSIPLQNLGSSSNNDGGRNGSYSHLEPPRYGAGSTSRDTIPLPTVSTYWDQPYDARSDGGASIESPIDPTALQAALPPDFHTSHDATDDLVPGRLNSFDNGPSYIEEPPNQDYADADTIPLTSRPQPISGSLSINNESQPRDSFQTVSDVDNNASRARDTLHPRGDVEYGHGTSRRRNFGMSLTPIEHQAPRSSATSEALHRASSIVRAMSQRVVNISGDAEIADQRASRHRSRSPQGSERTISRERSSSVFADTTYHSPATHPTAEKNCEQQHLTAEAPSFQGPRQPAPNPLKGRTLNIFESDSRVRLWFCDLLVNPYAEPLILVLIVLQTIFLTIESASNVFADGHGRPERWGRRWTDWVLLALFIIFTVELVARIIVSGFILNAAEYSTIDRQKGIRAAIADQYKAIFQPQQYKSAKSSSMQFPPAPSTIARSFTTLMQGQQGLPETLEEQQRYQLARRAFLRHSFNRLDFVAVVSFWISFILGICGFESRYHIYIFKMLSCLRILRLLALTHGTAVRAILGISATP